MNRNTRSLRREIARASRKGESEVKHQKPVGNWHNTDKPEFTTQTFPTAVPNQDGLISQNRKRNMAMRVYHNTDANGKTFSVTAHEPATKGEFVRNKGHNYIEYRQFR